MEHKIMLHELMIVMENFGVPYQEPTEDQQEQQKEKKQNVSKKQHIQNFINSDEGSLILDALLPLFNNQKFHEVKAALAEKMYTQLVKSKNRQATIELIKKDDFWHVLKNKFKLKIQETEPFQQILMLDAKYP